jgi:hypothetical protein
MTDCTFYIIMYVKVYNIQFCYTFDASMETIDSDNEQSDFIQ